MAWIEVPGKLDDAPSYLNTATGEKSMVPPLEILKRQLLQGRNTVLEDPAVTQAPKRRRGLIDGAMS